VHLLDFIIRIREKIKFSVYVLTICLTEWVKTCFFYDDSVALKIVIINASTKLRKKDLLQKVSPIYRKQFSRI